MVCKSVGCQPSKATRWPWSSWHLSHRSSFSAQCLDFWLATPSAAPGWAILAGSWLVIGTVTITSPAGSTTRVLGLVLCFVSVGLLVPIVAASLGKILAALVMLGAAIRFGLTGITEITGSPSWGHASGWWGFGLALLALYAAFAFEIEDTRRRTVLPTGRHGAGLAALNGTLSDNLERVVHEAGVREQL